MCGKEGYPFYMEKEIMEQPRVFEETIKHRIVNGLPNFRADRLDDRILKECNRICIVGCGTAMHIGLIAGALMKSVLHMDITVEMASEFMYSDSVIDEKTLVIAVSQSGETADTLEAIKYAKVCGALCLSVLNVHGSAISRVSDYVLYAEAGPEVAVASTKSYTSLLAAIYLLAARMAYLRGTLGEVETKIYLRELKQVSENIKCILEKRDEIHKIAKGVMESKDLFFIGRGMDYSVLLEGSLKFKEITNIHSEACASGELKYGPIALIKQDTPVVALVTQERLVSKELANIEEVKARGANVILFVKEKLEIPLKEGCHVMTLPNMDDKFMVFPSVVALQLLAYYVSLEKGFDVDRPNG